MMEWFEYLIVKFQLALAGFFGALVVTRYQKDAKTKKDVVVFVLSGAATAHYLSIPVGNWLKYSGENLGGIGFLLGMFGGAIIIAILRALEAADLWSLAKEIIKSRFGGGSQ